MMKYDRYADAHTMIHGENELYLDPITSEEDDSISYRRVRFKSHIEGAFPYVEGHPYCGRGGNNPILLNKEKLKKIVVNILDEKDDLNICKECWRMYVKSEVICRYYQEKGEIKRSVYFKGEDNE